MRQLRGAADRGGARVLVLWGDSVSARARWTAFLQQIEGRYKQICEEAEVGAREALAESGYDPIPIGNAWGAIQSRLQDLESKIIGTWNEKVQAAYGAEGIPHDVQMSDRANGADLAYRLENAREALQHRIFAEGARAMYSRAAATQRERACPTCGSPFDVPFSYQAMNLTCGHCRAVSTFEPGSLVRSVLAFGSHSLAWEAALRRVAPHARRRTEREGPSVSDAAARAEDVRARADRLLAEALRTTKAAMMPEVRGHQARSELAHGELVPLQRRARRRMARRGTTARSDLVSRKTPGTSLTIPRFAASFLGDARFRRRLGDAGTHDRRRDVVRGGDRFTDVAPPLALRTFVRLNVPARIGTPEGTPSGAAAGRTLFALAGIHRKSVHRARFPGQSAAESAHEGITRRRHRFPLRELLPRLELLDHLREPPLARRVPFRVGNPCHGIRACETAH